MARPRWERIHEEAKTIRLAQVGCKTPRRWISGDTAYFDAMNGGFMLPAKIAREPLCSQLFNF